MADIYNKLKILLLTIHIMDIWKRDTIKVQIKFI